MILIVDGFNVILNYVFFDGIGGQITQLRIQSFEGEPSSVHSTLMDRIGTMFDGVMDDARVDKTGQTEIRVLNATHLEVIDILRFCGLGVIEVAPSSPA